MRRPESERGQVLPFWAAAMSALAALSFYVINTANTLRWEIRAQTAADSVATAAVSTDANVLNNVSVLMYAAVIDEVRMRYMTQYMSDANLFYDPTAQKAQIPGSGKPLCKGGNGDGTSECDQDYQKLAGNYQNANQTLSNVVQQLRNLDFYWKDTRGDLSNLANSPIFDSNHQPICGIIGDCDFVYGVNTSKDPNQPGTIDVIACRVVAPLIPFFPSTTVIGHSAATLVPHAETLHPGADVDPNNINNPGVPYAPPVDLLDTGGDPQQTAWALDYGPNGANLTVNDTFYTVGWVQPHGLQADNGTGDPYGWPLPNPFQHGDCKP
jgi:hypothetical protein